MIDQITVLTGQTTNIAARNVSMGTKDHYIKDSTEKTGKRKISSQRTPDQVKSIDNEWILLYDLVYDVWNCKLHFCKNDSISSHRGCHVLDLNQFSLIVSYKDGVIG